MTTTSKEPSTSGERTIPSSPAGRGVPGGLATMDGTPQDRLRMALRSSYERMGRSSRLRLAPTGSMDPLLRGAAFVLVRWSSRTPPVGAVVLLTLDGLLLVHRLARISADGLCLQLADRFEYRTHFVGGWLPAERILGEVVAFWRDDRKYMLSEPPIRFLGRIAAKILSGMWLLSAGPEKEWFGIAAARRVGFEILKRTLRFLLVGTRAWCPRRSASDSLYVSARD